MKVRTIALACSLFVCLQTYQTVSADDSAADAPPSENAKHPEKEKRNDPAQWTAVDRGRYMVELLSCGACHTNGGIIGQPDSDNLLAGSNVGIAFSTPVLFAHPGVVYPPNITPDRETGIGGWTKRQIIRAIRDGKNVHGLQAGHVMPWENYAILTDEDALAIAEYLKSIPAIKHRVPDNVREGEEATAPYIYLGVYQQD